jgi:phage repressor protein C with HTH and peptisase S24 domain
VSDLADAEAARAEEAAMREAIAKWLADLVPTDNSMPMDAALTWSRQEWEREQAEQRRWLLDLAQARRHAEAAALLASGAPVVKLEDSSDDDIYRPMLPRFSDAGQGSNRWTPGQSSQ